MDIHFAASAHGSVQLHIRVRTLNLRRVAVGLLKYLDHRDLEFFHTFTEVQALILGRTRIETVSWSIPQIPARVVQILWSQFRLWIRFYQGRFSAAANAGVLIEFLL